MLSIRAGLSFKNFKAAVSAWLLIYKDSSKVKKGISLPCQDPNLSKNRFSEVAY